MSLSKKDVEYVANLSRLNLSEEELERFSGQLSNILDYINKLKELNVSETQPMSHVLDLKNVLRKDEVRPSLSNEEVLKSAPSQDRGHFKVPKVVE